MVQVIGDAELTKVKEPGAAARANGEADVRIAVDEEDGRAGFGGGVSGRKARGPAADDENVKRAIHRRRSIPDKVRHGGWWS